jgi:hypothetical protein
MDRRIIALVLVLFMWPVVASAQVVIQAPPVAIVAPAPRPVAPFWHRVRYRWQRWHHRHAIVVVAPGCCPTCCAPPVYAPPLPPPPPVPYYVLPPPPPPPPPAPVYAPPPPPAVVAAAPAPAPEPFPKVGLGVRGGVTSVGGTEWGAIGGHLRLRPSKHVALEIAVERMAVRRGEADRTDIPVTAGGLFYFLHGTFAPYLVVDIGANFASRDGQGISDQATHFVGRIGGGLELRVSPNFAIGADARYVARERVKGSPEQIPLTEQASSSSYYEPIGNEHGAEFRLAATLYF